MKYEKDFRQKYPESVGETDREYDKSNYTEFIEEQLEAFKNLANDSETMIESLEKHNKALRGYVNHKSECWGGQPKHEEMGAHYDCTCGLDELLGGK